MRTSPPAAGVTPAALSNRSGVGRARHDRLSCPSCGSKPSSGPRAPLALRARSIPAPGPISPTEIGRPAWFGDPWRVYLRTAVPHPPPKWRGSGGVWSPRHRCGFVPDGISPYIPPIARIGSGAGRVLTPVAGFPFGVWRSAPFVGGTSPTASQNRAASSTSRSLVHRFTRSVSGRAAYRGEDRRDRSGTAEEGEAPGSGGRAPFPRGGEGLRCDVPHSATRISNRSLCIKLRRDRINAPVPSGPTICIPPPSTPPPAAPYYYSIYNLY